MDSEFKYGGESSELIPDLGIDGEISVPLLTCTRVVCGCIWASFANWHG